MSERIKLTKEMLIERMLNDQVERKAAKAKEERTVLLNYLKYRDLKMRKALNQNTASKYYKRGGKR